MPGIPSLRTIVGWLLLIFVVWWAINNPGGVSGLLHSIAGGLSHAAHSAGQILSSFSSKH